MKNIKYFVLSVMMLVGFASCQPEHDFEATDKGPEMTVISHSDKAVMGSTISFEVGLVDALPLSTLAAELYFDETKVSNVSLRVKENGTHKGSIAVPYAPAIPDGTATLKIMGQNAHFGLTTQNFEVAITRPDPAYLTFVTTDAKEYRAERTEAFQYALTADLPQNISGYFKTPAIDDAGTVLTFGWDATKKLLALGTTDPIPFTYLNAGKWTITANIKTYATAPFLVPVKLNDTYMEAIANGFGLVTDLAQGSSYTISGVEGFAEFTADVDFFEKSGDAVKFIAPSGSHKVIINTATKFIYAEIFKDGAPAALQADGTGAIWVVGNNIGKPTLDNQVGWDTGKALCMAPIEAGKYQITLVGGTNVSLAAIDFKFFGGAKNWDNAFTHTTLTTTSDVVGIGTGAVDESGAKHDDGNLYIRKGKALEAGKTYLFTIDLSAGVTKGVLTVKEKSDDPDPYLVIIEQVDATTLAATLNLTQHKLIKLAGIDLSQWWVDDNFLKPNADGTLTVKVVNGKYRIVAHMATRRITVQRMMIDGSEATLNDDGTGAIYLMGWGAGVPSLDSQFAWNPGQAYCMAEVAPAVYRLTGKAGPEKGSVNGQYFRFDYISMKYFHQNGWGGEMKDPTFAPGTEKLLKNSGNLELADGVKLEENATYEFTVDLTAGNTKAVISFVKK